MKMVSENPAENIENTRSFLQFSTAKALPPDELEMMLAYNMEVPAKVRRHLLHRPAAYEATLRKITVPVLVTHGMEDRVALVPMARYTESVVANAQVSLYNGVGHMPFWEDAPRFNRELDEFVTKAQFALAKRLFVRPWRTLHLCPKDCFSVTALENLIVIFRALILDSRWRMDETKIGIGVSSIGRFLPLVGKAAGLFAKENISVEVVNQQDEEKVVTDIVTQATPSARPMLRP